MNSIFKTLICLTVNCLAVFVSAGAKTAEMPDWQNPQVVERNRLPMRAHFETDGLKQSLNGTEKTIILDANSKLGQILTGN